MVSPISQAPLPTLQQQLEQREMEIRMLREVTEMIGGEYDLETVLDRVAQYARDLVQADTVTIPLMSADRSSYTYRAAVGRNADELLHAELPIEIGICGWVLRHHKPWWRGILDELSVQERNRWEVDATTLVLVPLQGRRHFLGGIAGINKYGGREFSQHDFELLKLFAHHVSTAIENTMIFEELKEAKQRADAYREKLESLNARLTQTNAELQRLAVLDALTGLPNRTLIMDRLQQAIHEARRSGQAMALIMIDLDHFKEVNDTLGHGAGDDLLVGVGKSLLEALREHDTLGRLGGDEYAVVLPHADRRAALTVCEKLQQTLRLPIYVHDNAFSVAASMGVALYPEHGETPSELLKCADVAMYLAKRNRDELAIYSTDLDQYTPDRLELLQDLRVAIQQETVSLALQPKLDLRSNTVIGVEALARWTHTQRGVINPHEFIPVLEQTGLIKPFTLQMLDMAIGYCRRCMDRGYRLGMAINLSAQNLLDGKLPLQIADALARHRIDESLLTLEITETAIMYEPERSLGILQQLDQMGIALAIDDFGTGYSSLSYLKRLPVSQLKIDRSFVSEMIEDHHDAMIVRSTIDLAHNLGLTTVAEGVESGEIIERLKGMDCDMAQGYFISRPLSPDELLSYLEAGEWQVCKAASEDSG
jgi:diguanylate cyclase (GGDEF)-like protein